MADFLDTIDATTGEPTTTPIEAVKSEYAKGKIHLVAGTRVPVKLNGVEGTVPAEQYEDALAQGAEANFDPYGAAKATAVGAGSALTLGASDFAGEVGAWTSAKLSGGDSGKAVDDTRKALTSLQEEHPIGSIGGQIIGTLSPMGLEGLGGKVAGMAHMFHGAEDAAAAGKAAHQLEQAGQAASAAAHADAATGRLAGSPIGNTLKYLGAEEATGAASPAALRATQTVEGAAKGPSNILKYINPYNVVGTVAEHATAPLAKVFGHGTADIARLGVEGGLISAANAVDESELDPQLSGEAMWANVGLGVAFGSGLGLVTKAGGKILTATGMIGDRLGEAAAGGSGREYRDAASRWGYGALGHRNLEEGMKPFETAMEGKERLSGVVARDADTLDRVVKEADAGFAGVSAQEVRAAGQEALAGAADKLDMVGGNSAKFREPLQHDLDKHLGIRPMPEAPVPVEANAADKLYEGRRAQAGLAPEESIKAPKPPSEGEELRLGRRLAKEAGLGGLIVEKPIKVADAASLRRYQQEILLKMAQTRDPALGRLMLDPGALKASYLGELNKAVESRNAQRNEFVNQARQMLSDEYAAHAEAHVAFAEKHAKLRAKAAEEVAAQKRENDFNYQHAKRATEEYNKNLKVSLQHVREFRKVLDAHIPWTRSKDALMNAAIEVKQTMRGALEGKVEESFDNIAKKGNAEALGNYLHAKARYGQAKDLERMYERSTGNEAKSFGKLGIRGMGGHAMMIGAGAMLGHPLAGAAVGLGLAAGRHYGPNVAAYVLHKAAKIAQIKALQSEMEIAASRSVKAMLSPEGRATNYAKIGVPEMPPHQLRMTAADAMAAIYDNSKDNRKLIGRLASVDPGTVLLAPHAVEAQEGAARRALMYLVSRIPPSVKNLMDKGVKPGPGDVTGTEASDFMHETAATHDPQVALDAASKGHLTQGMAVAYKVAFPAHAAYVRATIQRMQQADRSNLQLISSGKRYGRELLAGDPNSGLTMALQMNLAADKAASAPAKGRGMSHATAFSKSDGILAQTLATESQSIESGPPGRRGKTGSSNLGL